MALPLTRMVLCMCVQFESKRIQSCQHARLTPHVVGVQKVADCDGSGCHLFFGGGVRSVCFQQLIHCVARKYSSVLYFVAWDNTTLPTEIASRWPHPKY